MLPGITSSHPALHSLEAYQTSFAAIFNLSKAGSDWLIDALIAVSAAAGACLFWSELHAADAVWLAAAAAASAVGAAWRRLSPASYARWREWLTAAQRVAIVAAPTTWHLTRLALERWEPYSSSQIERYSQMGAYSHTAWNAAAYLMGGVGASLAALHIVLALARPMRFWLHLPTQAALVALSAARNGASCRTRALAHPAATAATARAYRWLSAHAGITLGLPWLYEKAAGETESQQAREAAAEVAQQCTAEGGQGATPEQQCVAVLGFTQLLLGLVLPTAVLAVAESRLFLEVQLRRRQLVRQRRGLHRLAPAGVGASTSTAAAEAAPQSALAAATTAAAPAPAPAPAPDTSIDAPSTHTAGGSQQEVDGSMQRGAPGTTTISPLPGAPHEAASKRLRQLQAVQPSSTAVTRMYRGLYGVFIEAADPVLKWLLVATIAATCWQLAAAVAAVAAAAE